MAISRLWLAQGSLTEASAILQDGIALLPDSPDLLIALSDLRTQQNMPEEALSLLEQGVVNMGGTDAAAAGA